MTFLSSLLARPALRLPLLAGTVIATVATSAPNEPAWSKADNTKPQRVHLEPGASADVELDFEASQGLQIGVSIQNVSVGDTRLRIDMQDTRAVCDGAGSFIRTRGSWSSVENPEQRLPPVLRFQPHCFSSANNGTMTIAFSNESTTAFDFEWIVTATISGGGSDTAPDNAFVRIDEVE